MNIPEWLKPGLYGAVVGAVVVGVVGFSWGGWVTGSSADKMASAMAHETKLSALVPVCLDIARTDTDRAEKLETIKAAATYRRRDAVMRAGWATVPGAESPDRDLAEACLEQLDL